MDFRALDFWQQFTVGLVSILLVSLVLYGIAFWLAKRRERAADLDASLFGSSHSPADIHHDWESWQRNANAPR